MMADNYRSNADAEPSPRPLRPPQGRGLGALGMRVLRSFSPRGPWKSTPAATTSNAELPDDGLCLTSRSSSGTPVLPQVEACSRPPVAPARDTWRRPSPRRQTLTPRSSLSRADSTDSRAPSESSQWVPSSTSSLPPPGAFIRPRVVSESTNGTPRSCSTSRSTQGWNSSSDGCESQRRCLSARELSRSDRRDMLSDGSDSDRTKFHSARGHSSEKLSSYPRAEPTTQHLESTLASSSSEERVVQEHCLMLLDAVFDFPMEKKASKFMLEANPSIAWLGQCLHRCPLPPLWSALESRCGSDALRYVDMSAGIVSDSPPSMQQFVDLARVMLFCKSNPTQADFITSRLRAKHREHIAEAENARKIWNGPHIDPGTGEEYWHCMTTGQSTWGDPGAADEFLAQVVDKLIQTVPNEISAKTASSRQNSARGANSQWSTLPQWMQLPTSSMSNTLSGNGKESTLYDVGMSICQDRASNRTRKDLTRPSSRGALPNDDSKQSWWSSAMTDPFEGGVAQQDVVLRPESRRRRPQSCERLEPISKPQESPRSSTPRSKSRGKDEGARQSLKREEVVEGYSYIGKYAKEPAKPATEIMQTFQVFEAEAQLKKLPPPPPPPPLASARRPHIVREAEKPAAVDSAPADFTSDSLPGDLPQTPSTCQGDSNLKSSGSMSKGQDDTPSPKDSSPTCSETSPADQRSTCQGDSYFKSSGSMSKGQDVIPSPKVLSPKCSETSPIDQPIASQGNSTSISMSKGQDDVPSPEVLTPTCSENSPTDQPSTCQEDRNFKASGSMPKGHDDIPSPKVLSPVCSETSPTDQAITSQGDSNFKSSRSMSKGQDGTSSAKVLSTEPSSTEQPCDTCVSGNLDEATSPIHQCIDQNDKATNDEQRLEEVTMLNALAHATCSTTTCSTDMQMAKCELADDANPTQFCTNALEETIISPKNDGVALASDSMVQKLDFAFTGSSCQPIVSSSPNENSAIHRRPLGNTVEWFEIGTPAHSSKSGPLLDSLHSSSNAENAMAASSKQVYIGTPAHSSKSGPLLDSLHSTSNAENATAASLKQMYELSPKAYAIDAAAVTNGSKSSQELNDETQESSHGPGLIDRELVAAKDCDSSQNNCGKKEEETENAEAITSMNDFTHEEMCVRNDTEVSTHAGESNLESEVIAKASEFTQRDEANDLSQSGFVREDKREATYVSECAQEQIDKVDEGLPGGCIMAKEITKTSDPTEQNQRVQDLSHSACLVDQELSPKGTQVAEEQLHEMSQSIGGIRQDAVAKASELSFEQNRKTQELSTINLEEQVQDQVTNVSHLSQQQKDTTVEASHNMMEMERKEDSTKQQNKERDLSSSSTSVKKGVQVNVSQAEVENVSEICELVSPNAGSDVGVHDRTCTSVHTCSTERHNDDLAVHEIGVTGRLKDVSRVSSEVGKDCTAMVHARREHTLDELGEKSEPKEESCSDESIVKPIGGNASSVDLSLLERELADESLHELAVESKNSTMLANKEEPLLADVSEINAELGQTHGNARAPFDFAVSDRPKTGFARSRTTWSNATDSSDKEGLCALSRAEIDSKVECASVMEEDSVTVVNHSEKMPTQSATKTAYPANPPPQQRVRESALTWVESVAYGKKSRDMEALGDLIWGPAPEFDTSPRDEQRNEAGSEKLPGSTISPTSATPSRPKRPPRNSAYRSTSRAELEPMSTTFEEPKPVITNAQAPSLKVSRPRGCTRVVGNRMAPAGGA